MNYITAMVESIQEYEGVNFVLCRAGSQALYVMSLALGQSIAPGVEVSLGVKSTNVSLAKGFEGHISIAAQLRAEVVSIEHGELMSCVTLGMDGITLESIVMRQTVEKMALTMGDNVLALIKATDLSIVEVLDC